MIWLLAVACSGCRKPVVPVPVEVHEAAPKRAPTPGLYGINEALSVPAKLAPRMTDGEIEQALFADAEAVAGLGAGWVRAHTAVYPNAHQQSYQQDPEAFFDRVDRWMRAAQSQELDVVFMLSPWPGNETANATDAYLPDAAAYQAYVRAVVERYDGDGVDDMPGLTHPVTHWEADNEPDLKHTLPPRGGALPEDFCTPQEYAQVLSWTLSAVKEADPEAVVLGGGFYRPMTPQGDEYMRAVLALAQPDVLSLHVYGDDLARWTQALDNAQAAFDGPLWLTETNWPGQDLQAQAEMVTALHELAWERGVGAVFWHTLADPPAGRGRKGPGMRSNSLLQADPPRGYLDKPAAQAYRALTRSPAAAPPGR